MLFDIKPSPKLGLFTHVHIFLSSERERESIHIHILLTHNRGGDRQADGQKFQHVRMYAI